MRTCCDEALDRLRVARIIFCGEIRGDLSAGDRDHVLIHFWQLRPFRAVDIEKAVGAFLPPAGIVVIGRDVRLV